jgi:hypothetical protein
VAAAGGLGSSSFANYFPEQGIAPRDLLKQLESSPSGSSRNGSPIMASNSKGRSGSSSSPLNDYTSAYLSAGDAYASVGESEPPLPAFDYSNAEYNLTSIDASSPQPNGSPAHQNNSNENSTQISSRSNFSFTSPNHGISSRRNSVDYSQNEPDSPRVSVSMTVSSPSMSQSTEDVSGTGETGTGTDDAAATATRGVAMGKDSVKTAKDERGKTKTNRFDWKMDAGATGSNSTTNAGRATTVADASTRAKRHSPPRFIQQSMNFANNREGSAPVGTVVHGASRWSSYVRFRNRTNVCPATGEVFVGRKAPFVDKRDHLRLLYTRRDQDDDYYRNAYRGDGNSNTHRDRNHNGSDVNWSAYPADIYSDQTGRYPADNHYTHGESHFPQFLDPLTRGAPSAEIARVFDDMCSPEESCAGRIDRKSWVLQFVDFLQ